MSVQEFERLRLALAHLSKGYQEAEKSVNTDSIKQKLVWLSIRRFINHTEAIILLIDNGHNLEALMILRPLLELAVNARWIIEDGTDHRLDQFLSATQYNDRDEIPEMGNLWADRDLKRRMSDIGLDDDYYRMVVKKLHEELHNHPARIARAYGDKLTAVGGDSIGDVATQMAVHLLIAAQHVYPKLFREQDYRTILQGMEPNPWHIKRRAKIKRSLKQRHDESWAARTRISTPAYRTPDVRQEQTAELHNAILIAAQAHNGQKRKNGLPYLLHPFRVMLRMSTEKEMIVAILHDVIEDTSVTVEDLKAKRFAEDILTALSLLTKKRGQDYERYIAAISRNALARKVKIADLEDNMNLDELPEIRDKDLARNDKYRKALQRLRA